MNYESANGIFPPGQMKMTTKPPSGVTLFVGLLPYLEQQPLLQRVELQLPVRQPLQPHGPVGHGHRRSDLPGRHHPGEPVQNGTTSNEWYGITSYGGNAGSQSHPFSAVTYDGIFFYTGPAAPTFYQVRIANITDGLSNTLFFGERCHFDPNYDTFAPPGWTFFSQTMGMWGWWASSSGGYGLSDVAESTYSPINYVVPISYGNPNVSQTTFTTTYEYPRVNAFGSLHPGGANFAMVDGSVRFLKQTIAQPVYHALGTRAGGEVISADSY